MAGMHPETEQGFRADFLASPTGLSSSSLSATC